MLIDMFTYTDVTPGGELDVNDLIDAAIDADLDGICITDKDYSAHAEEIMEAAADADLFVGIGVEIELQNGRVTCYPPAVDQFLISEEWRELTGFGFPGAQEVIDLLREEGGVVVARDVYTKTNVTSLGDAIFGLHHLAALDVLSPARTRIQNELALEAAVSLHLPGVAGSGALKSTDDIGKAATIFSSEIATQQDLVNALKQRDGWAAQLGPMDGAAPTGSAPRRDKGGGNRGGGNGGRGGKGRGKGGRRRRGRRKPRD